MPRAEAVGGPKRSVGRPSSGGARDDCNTPLSCLGDPTSPPLTTSDRRNLDHTNSRHRCRLLDVVRGRPGRDGPGRARRTDTANRCPQVVVRLVAGSGQPTPTSAGLPRTSRVTEGPAGSRRRAVGQGSTSRRGARAGVHGAASVRGGARVGAVTAGHIDAVAGAIRNLDQVVAAEFVTMPTNSCPMLSGWGSMPSTAAAATWRDS